MDANMIASLEALQAQSGWAAFEAEYTAKTRECGSGVRPDLAFTAGVCARSTTFPTVMA